MRMRAFRALAPVRYAPGQRDSARPDSFASLRTGSSLRGLKPNVTYLAFCLDLCQGAASARRQDVAEQDGFSRCF